MIYWLEFVICFYYPERKFKATEDLCGLDTPSADPWTKEGLCGKGLCFATVSRLRTGTPAAWGKLWLVMKLGSIFLEPGNKLNNKMWVGENNECPVVARWSRSVRRVMYALVFDSNGIVARVSVPENCSVTGTFYRDFVLSAIVNHYQA